MGPDKEKKGSSSGLDSSSSSSSSSSKSSQQQPTPPLLDMVWRLDGLLPTTRLPTDHDRAPHGVPQPFVLGTVSSPPRCPFAGAPQGDREAMLLALFGGLVRRYVREAEVALGLVTAEGAVLGVPMHGILGQDGLSVAEAAAAVADLLKGAAPLAEMVAAAGGNEGLLGQRLGTQAFSVQPTGASVPHSWPVLCLCDSAGAGAAAAAASVEAGEERDICLLVHGAASFTLRYNARLFSAAMAEAMLRSWETLLIEAARDATVPLDLVPCVSPADAQWLVQGCNQTAAAFAPREGIHQLFEARVDEGPHRVAIIGPPDDDAEAYPERAMELTYEDVEAAANQMARYLLKCGSLAGDNGIVAILLERSVGFYVAMLGVLKAGAAYLSIDPDYPDERIHFMLEDSRAVALVTTMALAARVRKTAAAAAATTTTTLQHVLCLDNPKQVARVQAEPPTRPEWVAVDPEWICYVIYTSGSTGKPKGVQISHANALNLIRAEEVIYCVEPSDRVLQGFSTSFDASVEEVWMAFNSGAALVVGTKEVMRSGPDFPSYLEALGVTCLSTVPTLLATVRLRARVGWLNGKST
jgi:hypothetical protein